MRGRSDDRPPPLCKNKGGGGRIRATETSPPIAQAHQGEVNTKMKKIYPSTKIYAIIAGVMTFWFILGTLVVMLAPEIENKSGVLFLILLSILGIPTFIRTLRFNVSSDATAIYFKTFLKDIELPWNNITEIQAKLGRTGLYYLLIGKSATGDMQKINLGILKKK